MNAISLPMKVALLALFFLYPQISIGQTPKIDSLKPLLSVTSGVEYSDVLFELSRQYLDVDNGLSLQHANNAFERANQNGDSIRIVKTGRVKSQALRRLGKIDSSLALYNRILPIARRHNCIDELKYILNGLGVIYVFNAQYDKALKCNFESLGLREKDGNKFDIGVALNNIAMVYYKLKDYDNALSYFKQSLQLKGEIDHNSESDITLTNIGLCYAYKNNFTDALSFVNRGFYLCGDNCSENFLTNARFSLGVISFGQRNFLEAERQFLKSYALARKLENARFQLDNIVYLLRIYIEHRQMQLVEHYLKEAETLIASGTSHNLELIKVYTQLVAVYSKSGDFRKVAFYQGKYIALKDSIYNDELTTNLMKVEAEHLDKENKLKIESQNKIHALNREVIYRQRFLNIFIGIVAMLLVALATVLFKSNQQKRKINHLLDKKVKERTQELELNRDALQRACEERDVVIHKAAIDIKSSLATIKGLCALGLKDIKDPGAGEYLKKVDITSDNFSGVLNRLFLINKVSVPT
jgi:hypothetical protein